MDMAAGKSYTRSSRGKVERRILVEKGRYAIVKYLDVEKNEEVRGKFKIYLDSGGKRRGFLMIKLKEGNRYLAIPDDDVDPELYAYNPETGMEEPIP